MGIYVFFGAFTASIVSLNFLRKRLCRCTHPIYLAEQSIVLETAQELRTSETSSESHEETLPGLQEPLQEEGGSSSDNEKPSSEKPSNDSSSPNDEEPLLENNEQPSLEDETTWPLINHSSSGVPSYNKLLTWFSGFRVYTKPSTQCDPMTANGYSLVCNSALSPNPWLLKLNFPTPSYPPVVTIDFRDFQSSADYGDNNKWSAAIALRNLPTEPITVKIRVSSIYSWFFKKTSERFLYVRNETSQAPRLYLVVQSYDFNKGEAIKSTKFQLFVPSPSTKVSIIHLFETEPGEGSSSDFSALVQEYDTDPQPVS